MVADSERQRTSGAGQRSRSGEPTAERRGSRKEWSRRRYEIAEPLRG